MPLPGHYVINYTDPAKGSFIIEPDKTDGTESPIKSALDFDANDAHTSILIYGRENPNYGERIQENLVHLMENFAGPFEPVNPTHGQAWYDTGSAHFIVNVLVSPTNQIIISGNYVTEILAQGTFSLRDNIAETITVWTVNTATYNGGTNQTTITTNEAITLSYSDAYIFWLAPSPTFRIFNDPNFDQSGQWDAVNKIVIGHTPPENPSEGEFWLDSSDDLHGGNPQLRVYDTAQAYTFDNGNGTSIDTINTNWISTSLNYLALVGGTMQGPLNVNLPTLDDHAASKWYVDDEINTLSTTLSGSIGDKVAKIGDTMTGDLLMSTADISFITSSQTLDMNTGYIINVVDPTNPQDAATKNYIDGVLGAGAFTNPDDVDTRVAALESITGITATDIFVNIAGDTMTGDLDFVVTSSGLSSGITFSEVNENHFIKVYEDGAGQSQLILQSGDGADDYITFRHNLTGPGISNIIHFKRSTIEPLVGIDFATGPHTIINVPDPTNPQDVATKAYVDFVGGGGGVADGVLISGSYTDATTTLTLNTDIPTAINIDMSHTQESYTVIHTISPSSLEEGLDDYLGPGGPAAHLDYPNVPIDSIITGLDVIKAPRQDPIFSGTVEAANEADIVGVTLSNTFTVAGDVESQFEADFTFLVVDSTANDGTYTVVSSTFGGTNTDIVVAETIPSATVDGAIEYAFVATEDTHVATKQYVDHAVKVDRSVIVSTGASSYATPAYEVGSNKLWIFVNGQKWIEGASYGYTEVGAVGTLSTSINLVAPYPPVGAIIEILVFGHGH